MKKELSATQKELLRNAILFQLHEARPLGLPSNTLELGVRSAGFQTIEESEVGKHLRYLCAHDMIELSKRAMNQAVDYYRITGSGVEWLDECGLI